MRQRSITLDGKVYRPGPGESALSAMLGGGADLSFSCRKGVCRSCMLESVSGDPGPESRRTLPESMASAGAFLPCLCTSPDSVVARRPDPSRYATRAQLAGRTQLAPDIWQVLIETETVLDWRPGQVIGIAAPGGEVRSYSVVSRPDDYYLEIHLRHYPGGVVSDWLVNHLRPDEMFRLTGPAGPMHYDPSHADRPLWLLGTGTGGGALAGIARDALMRGHKGPITLWHGARRPEHLYLDVHLRALVSDYPDVAVHLSATGTGAARITELAFDGRSDLSGHVLYLCGAPDMVEAGRIRALAQGADRARILADPFDPPWPHQPRDAALIAAIEPDPALWQALDNGPRLTAILQDFYNRVFDDARLSPFFQKVTKRRPVEKQYAFLADLFTGARDYFGERPFNSHHWMVISDALFDYREELFFEVARAHGVGQPHLGRWAALHELFRREIVKPAERGRWLDGAEVLQPRFSDEVVTVATICDKCMDEIPEGVQARLVLRTGELFCAACARHDTLNPAASPA